MILRKPYAFLIKYFRIINGILSLLAIYIVYRVYNVATFFNEYISNNYTGSFYSGFAGEYISSFSYFIIILILIGLLVILLLFIYKKKPLKAYAVPFAFYILLIIFFTVMKDIMTSLESTTLTAQTIRVCRDISFLVIVPQIGFIILFLIRALGFNKSLNFEADLKELEIDASDNEEVEITFNNDGTKIKRFFRRYKREFSYYLKENKFIIICVIIVLGIGFLGYLFYPREKDQKYIQGDTFAVGGVTYKLEDSIITNLDYKGDIINSNNYYLVVKLYIENNQENDSLFDANNFRLEVGKDILYPQKYKGSYFIDYAASNIKNTIKAKNKYYYPLVYEISKDDIKNSYVIRINNGLKNKGNMQVAKLNYITINPTRIDQIIKENEYIVNEKALLNNSNLNNSSFMVTNFEITNKYIYDYEMCEYGICNNYKNQVSVNYLNNDRTLLVLDYDFNLDQDCPYYKYSKTLESFINNFVKIKYKYNEEEIYGTVSNVTPNNLENKIILEVSKDIEEAEEVSLIIRVRNKEYSIKLK